MTERAPKSGKQRTLSQEDRQRMLRLITLASFGTALVLIAVKLVAWFMTDSVSLLSSLIDSLLDAAASLVTLIAVRQAMVPPDREHRFGHGKAEPLAALAQSAFIGGSAVFLLSEAGIRLISPQPVTHPTVGIGVMVFAILCSLVLTIAQGRVAKRTGSVAIAADRLHYLSDLLVNATVILALVLSAELGWHLADPILAIVIAFYILKTAWQVGREAFDMLMDRELPSEERKKIIEIVRAEPQVRGLHDLRTRASGPQIFIQMHIDLDADLPLAQAHEIADALELQLAEAFNGAEVIIHQDPYPDPGHLPKPSPDPLPS